MQSFDANFTGILIWAYVLHLSEFIKTYKITFSVTFSIADKTFSIGNSIINFVEIINRFSFGNLDYMRTVKHLYAKNCGFDNLGF